MTDLLARLMIWLEDRLDGIENLLDRVEDRVYEIREKRGQL